MSPSRAGDGTAILSHENRIYFRSMRKTKTCPKCDCKKLLHIAVVADARGDAGGATEASLAVRFEGHSFLGNEKHRAVGKLEAVTCSECGYTEHYVLNPKELQPDGKNISWLT